MLTKYNLTSRQFIIGGITLSVLMLLINLSLPLDAFLRTVTVVIGAVGLGLAVIFAVSSRSKNGETPPEDA